MVRVVGGGTRTSLLPKEDAGKRAIPSFFGILVAVAFASVIGVVLMGPAPGRTSLLQRPPTALEAHYQMLEGEEAGGGDGGSSIPDPRAADQGDVMEGKVRYMVAGQVYDLPECGTTHCEMMRACMVHAGEEESCYAVEPFCAECGERKPCYYAFGRCRLRNGYGPKTKVRPAGNASQVMRGIRNGTKTVNFDNRAIKRVLGALQPQYRKHLQLWDWKTRRYITNHHYNEGVRRRWIRRKTGKYVPKGELQEENAAADAKSIELEWCNWGEEMVPCAPGFGGAWYAAGHRQADYGIWPMEEESGPVSHSPHNVYAGKRSDSYIGHHNPIPQPDDLLYGSAQDAQPEEEEEEEETGKEETGEEEKEEAGEQGEEEAEAPAAPESTPDKKNGFINKK